MSKYIGRLVKVGIGRELVRGNGVAPTFTLPFSKLAFDDKIVQARSVGALGVLADSEEAFVTTKYGQGDLDGELRVKSLGLLLYALLGSVVSTGPTDSSYSHAFAITQSNQHQSLAFVVQDSNTTELYQLVMIDSFKINAALDKVISYTAGFFSKTARDTGLTAPAIVHESKFTKKHISIKLADTIAGLAAATPISVKALNLNINKNVKIDDVIGTAEPEDILNNQLSVDGDLELNYEAETYKQYMLNGTYKCMQILFQNNDDTIGSAQHPSLTLQFPKVDFHGWAPNYDLDKISSQKISFKMSRDVANSLDVISTCTLVNDVISY
jgi:hypothetical protein